MAQFPGRRGFFPFLRNAGVPLFSVLGIRVVAHYSWFAIAALIVWAIYLLTSVLTELVSNNAVAVVVTPIAIDAALRLGADPRSFVIGVVLAASTSFLMPIGHQVNVIIFGPGGYQFSDYTRVGALLNLILLIVVLLTLPLIWPLYP